MYENAQGAGAQPVPTVTDKNNITACVEYCLRNRNCTGVEYTAGASVPCAYYTNTSSQISGMNQRQTKAWTTQYQLVDRCYSGMSFILILTLFFLF